MKTRFDTYCGLYCGACMIMKANINGTVNDLASTWEMKAADLKCRGCKTDINYKHCADCKIKECNRNKNLESCHECNDFPCSIISDFKNDDRPHHSIVLRNLKEIKKSGLTTWMENQKDRWSCPECGHSFSWYEKTCDICNRELFNAKDEEKNGHGGEYV